ncbi:MAG: TonB-dependent receptor [Candidatus Aminicenantes bacterium]|nr:TonB-dependent receptor [Candidatus Aminicenantes bacterium]NIM84799.1 TonB-dependent receptor [Candidatus Aminicenantes bacterium]NIN24302.1 TonB-dependent receptor [Candidatus Aminicenantes bacterium]NIN48061.1 TonB-dependent receptor [Candidatus Aminicenantes bacterium]NIN90962.1 TonB-dependent receptor [Candidatus Aminicenantes bacterium]
MRIKGKSILLLAVVYGLFLFKAGLCGQDVQKKDEDLLKKLLDVNISTASKYSQTVSEAPASVTIITSDETEQFGYRTLDEVLMRVRGFYITNDRNYNYVGVRGFSRPTDYNNRILLLLNGNPTNDNVWGASYIGPELGLDLDAIERIEIVRGPGSALYGTNAMLAVVNIITKKGKTVDGLKMTFQPGSYGKIQGGMRFGKEFKNGPDVLISGLMGKIKGQDLYFEEYDDPATNNGIAEGLDWDEYWGVFTSLTYKNFSLQGIISSREKAVPTASYETAFNDDRNKTLDTRGLIELKYEGNISYDKKIMMRGSYYYYLYEGDFPYDDPDYQVLFEEKSIGEWIGIETQFNWDIRANNRLIIGGEYKKHFRSLYKSWDDYGILFDQNYPFQQFAFYVQDEYQFLQNLSVTLGVRYDKHDGRGESLSPRAAVIYNPSRFTALKLLFGNAYRAPDFYALYYESEDEAKANPFVKPEKINTVEAVVEHQFSKNIMGILCLYTFEMRGLIEQVEDPSDGLLQFQNLEKVRGKGVEAELNIRLKNGFKGYVNYNLQNNKNVIEDEKITNSPSHLFKLGLSVPIFTHFFASLETFYESNRITLDRVKTKPYLLTNLHLSSQKLFDHFKFSFQIKNLFAVAYRTPGGYEHIQDSLLQDGRTFTLKLEYIF